MTTPHILVPTDLSPSSCAAFSHAAGLALALSGRVTLLHVDNLSGVDLTLWGESALRERILSELTQRRHVIEAHREVLESMGTRVQAEIVTGQPASAILEFAELEAVDFIVISKQGFSLLDRFLMGSVTKAMVRRSPIPVLFVEGEEVPSFERPEHYRSILNTTDFSRDSSRGLRATLDLALMLEAKITLTHIIQPPTFMIAPGEMMLSPESTGSVCAYYQAELERAVAEVEPGRVELIAEIGQPIAQAIAKLADARDVDLITVPSHGKGAVMGALVGSTTQRLIKLTRRPVLVFPPAYLEAHYG